MYIKLISTSVLKKNGAGDEGRTRDIQLGRLTLYQLSYSRIKLLMVGVVGFEPTTPCSQGRCATELRYTPSFNFMFYLSFQTRTILPFLLSIVNYFFYFFIILLSNRVKSTIFHYLKCHFTVNLEIINFIHMDVFYLRIPFCF